LLSETPPLMMMMQSSVDGKTTMPLAPEREGEKV
jgi:hypothetical protein